MAGEDWTDDELRACVEAYIEMLLLEERGAPYNKSDFRRRLLAGPLRGRTTSEQRMQNISSIMRDLGRGWIAGYKPLSNIGTGTAARLNAIVLTCLEESRTPKPLRAPIAVPARRTMPPTGYWMLVCNPDQWDARKWLMIGESRLLYRVNDHNENELQVGDLGFIWVKGTGKKGVNPNGPSVFAIVEAVSKPKVQADPDVRGYQNTRDATNVVLRAEFRIVANLVRSPVLASSLPGDADFDILRKALQFSTIPVTRQAFAGLWKLSGASSANLDAERLAETKSGVEQLERQADGATPERKERLSKYIERGTIGNAVKEKLGHRCQVCEAQGAPSIAFIKKGGLPYAEAHHVQPVSLLLAGTLGAANIMVLCPNHHRQAHYGDVIVDRYETDCWWVTIDGKSHRIERGGLGL